MKLLDNPEKLSFIIKELDEKFKSEEIPIPDRPVLAIFEAGEHDSAEISHQTVFGLGRPPAPYAAKFAETVNNWFLERYGELVKKDLSLGKKVVSIQDDLWVLQIPQIMGRVEFVASADQPTSKADYVSGKPYIYNVVDSVKRMTDAQKRELPDYERAFIFEKFIVGFQSLSIVKACISQLPEAQNICLAAEADLNASVNHLISSTPEYGQSKWASLQFAEKIMKAAILSKGVDFARGHVLEKIANQLRTVGISTGSLETLFPHIQCAAGVRYGDLPVNRDEALIAHNAAFVVPKVLRDSGANFKIMHAF